MSKDKIQKIVLFAVWIAIIGISYYFYKVKGIPLAEYPQFIRDTIASAGIFGPITYILLYAVRPLIFFPATILSAASGVLFPTFNGIVYTVIGANLSANLAFVVSRYFGRNLISQNEVGWVKKFDDKLTNNGFMTIFIMRLIYLPFDLVNYGAGLTGIKQRDFALGTFLGTLPGSVTFVLIGSSFTNWKNLVVAGITFVGGLILSRYLKKRHQDLAAVPAAAEAAVPVNEDVK